MSRFILLVVGLAALATAQNTCTTLDTPRLCGSESVRPHILSPPLRPL